MSESLTLLALADAHYAARASGAVALANNRAALGAELAERAVREACRLCSPDAIVLLGDTIADGKNPRADEDLTDFAAVLRKTNLPVIAVPGNHDGDPARLLGAFGDHLGAHRINGHILYTFADDYAADDSATRAPETLARFETESGGAPIIAIQHSPIYPPVDSTHYPYMPRNAPAILDSYERKGVLLSISGHYHRGQPLSEHNGVQYLTCGALGEAPFPFTVIRSDGQRAQVETHQLVLPAEAALSDGHVHTHFGRCAVDVHPVPVLERIRALGIRRVACVEHAGQLYLEAEEYWSHRHVEDPDAIARARGSKANRFAEYRADMARFRSESLAVGIEVECDRDGKLNLLDEDRAGWDVLLGAVHWLPSNLPASTPEECLRSFMTVTEQLLRNGVDVLAHPFRLCEQKKLDRPRALYRPLARLLKTHGVAAEINFHLHAPDPEFYGVCLEEGVRLTTGSDGHRLADVGDLHPHARLLRGFGAPLQTGIK